MQQMPVSTMETEAIPIPRFLSSLPLFHDLSTEELGRIAQGCQLRRLGRGEMVFRVGQPCDECHAVISGQVKLFAISPDGHEKVIELVGPGNCFAEAVMFLGRPYIVNAQALVSTLLLTVSKRVILAEIQRDPRLALQMLAGTVRAGLSLPDRLSASGCAHRCIVGVIDGLPAGRQGHDCLPVVYDA